MSNAPVRERRPSWDLPLRRLAEAGVHLAIISAILVFSPLTHRGFEADKLVFVRSAAWLVSAAGLAWLGLETMRRGRLPTTGLRGPLLVTVAALGVSYLASVIFSLDLSVSLHGNYIRQDGAFSTLAFVVLAAGVTWTAREAEAAGRLVRTAIFASIPAAAVALLQAADVELLHLRAPASGRSSGTFGSGLFLATALAPIIPLTLWQLWLAWRRRSTLSDPRSTLALAVYGVAAASQLGALVASGSRGPVLALVGGAAVATAVYAVAQRRSRLWWGALAVPVAVLVAALAFRADSQTGKRSQGAARLMHTFDMSHPSSASRLAIWDDFAGLLTARAEPLEDTAGGTDPNAGVRSAIGYGPQTQLSVIPRLRSAAMSGLNDERAKVDRAHNELWDVGASRGFVGVLALLAFMGTVFLTATRALRVTRGRRDWLFIALGTVAGSAGAVAIGGVGLLGLGLGLGLVAGLMGRMADAALADCGAIAPVALPAGCTDLDVREPSAEPTVILGQSPRHETPMGPAREPLLIGALLVALTVHWLDAQVSVPLAASRVMLALVVGLLLARTARGTAAGPVAAAQSGVWMEAGVAGVAGALTIGGLLGDPSRESTLALLASLPLREIAAVTVAPLALWLIGTATQASSPRRRKLGLAAALAGAVTACGAVAVASRLGGLSAASSDGILGFVDGLASTHDALMAFAMLSACVAAAVSCGRQWGPGVAAALLCLVAVGVPARAELQIVHADTTFKVAEEHNRLGQLAVAMPLYKRASEQLRREDQYARRLANRAYKMATLAEEPVQRQLWVDVALEAGELARATRPYKLEHLINLARVVRWQAGASGDPVTRGALAARADDLLARAQRLSSNGSRATYERGLLHLHLLGDPEAGEALARLALRRDPERAAVWWLLGLSLRQQATRATDPIEQLSYVLEASEALEHAVTPTLARLPLPRADAHMAVAESFVMQADLASARWHLKQALKHAPDRSDEFRALMVRWWNERYLEGENDSAE